MIVWNTTQHGWKTAGPSCHHANEATVVFHVTLLNDGELRYQKESVTSFRLSNLFSWPVFAPPLPYYSFPKATGSCRFPRVFLLFFFT